MKFVNCTPHALTIEGLGTIAPCGVVPRCATVRTVAAREQALNELQRV